MAARFFVGGNGNNWGATGPTNWSTTSGGAPGAAVPTNADDVTFDASSPACTLDTTGRVCRRLTFAAYANTITFNQTLTVTPDSGSTGVILGGSMTFAGASALIITGPTSGSTSITSNGKTVGVPLTLAGNATTITLTDNWTASGLVSVGGVGAVTINGNTLNVGGSLTHTSGSNAGGTTTIVMNGTGTYSHSSTGALTSPLTFNTAGTITISGTVRFNGATLTYTAGTMVTTGSTLIVNSGATGAVTLNTSAMTWEAVQFPSNAGTLTLTSDFVMSGTFTLSGTSATINGAFNFKVGGSVTDTGSTTLSGTATLVMTGTGTWSSSRTNWRLNVTFNASGTITISGTINFNTATLTYTAGTLVVTGSTIVMTAAVTFHMAGQSLASITCVTAGVILTLASGLELTTAVTLLGTAASPVQLKSSSAGTQRKFTVPTTVSQDIGYTNPTDIDSGDAGVVRAFKPTLSNTINWQSLTPTTGGASTAGAWAYA